MEVKDSLIDGDLLSNDNSPSTSTDRTSLASVQIKLSNSKYAKFTLVTGREITQHWCFENFYCW